VRSGSACGRGSSWTSARGIISTCFNEGVGSNSRCWPLLAPDCWPASLARKSSSMRFHTHVEHVKRLPSRPEAGAWIFPRLTIHAFGVGGGPALKPVAAAGPR
jgi:hypothetical protein